MTNTNTVNVPTVLEQKLLGTPITRDVKLSRAELRSVFYIGRRLELVECYVPMSPPMIRTVKEHKSYGYVMDCGSSKTSYLRFEKGETIIGESFSLGFSAIRIVGADGKTAARYLLP
jgi:hypothetical protein